MQANCLTWSRRAAQLLLLVLISQPAPALSQTAAVCPIPNLPSPVSFCWDECMRHCGEVVSCVSDKGYYYDSFGCAGCASYDLKVKTNDDGLAIVVPGEVLTYTIEVVNFGITAVAGARVLDPFPLQAVVWTCVGDGGASCTGSGSGDISDTVTLPVGGRVTYTATGTVPLVAAGTLSNTASVTAPQGVTDPDLGNNS